MKKTFQLGPDVSLVAGGSWESFSEEETGFQDDGRDRLKICREEGT